MRVIYTIFTVFWRRRVHPVSGWYVLSGDRLCRIWGMRTERLRPLGRFGPGRMGHESHSYGLASECISRRLRKRKKPYISLIHKVSLLVAFSFEGLWSGKRDSDPRPQPWQGCALKPPKRYAFRGNQLSYFLLRRFSRMCFTSFFALVKRMVKHLRLSADL